MLKTHSFYDPDELETLEQKWINRYFYFKYGQVASCKVHNIPRCQCCTDDAIGNSRTKKAPVHYS